MMCWLKKLFRRKWPKVIKITVRDGECNFLDSTFISINSWKELMPRASEFAQDVMASWPSEELDEVYWECEEV